jgi:membrane-associated protein
MNRKALLKAIAVVLVLVAVFVVLQKVVSVDKIFKTGGIFALAATIFAETGLLVGFFLPGDTLLFAAGFFSSQGKVNIAVTLLALFAGAVLGNMLGYEIGRRGGPKAFNKPDSVFFHKENMDKAHSFFNRYGSATIIIARFVPIVRTLASPLAGMGHMPYGRFMLYNVIGAALWVPVITLIGYWAGKVLGKFINIDHYILPAVLFATLLTFGISFWHLMRDPKNRERFKQKYLAKQ